MEYSVKWLLEYRLQQEIQKLTTEQTMNNSNIHEIQLNIQQLRDELQRIHPSNQTRDDIPLRPTSSSTLHLTTSSSSSVSPFPPPLTSASPTTTTTPTPLPSRPLIRVCDILKTEIVGVEVLYCMSDSLSHSSLLRLVREEATIITM